MRIIIMSSKGIAINDIYAYTADNFAHFLWNMSIIALYKLNILTSVVVATVALII